MKTLGYIRISKESSDVENQRYEINRYLQHNPPLSTTPIKWTEEVVSGRVKAENRELGKLVESLQMGDTLVVADVSRLGRKTLDVMSVCAEVMNRKARLIIVKNNWELKDDIQSSALLFAFSMAAQIEREMISARTKAAIDAQKAAGTFKGGRPRGATSSKLHVHEKEVLQLLELGVTKARIAKHFDVTPPTVRAFLKKYAKKHGKEALDKIMKGKKFEPIKKKK
jgi:DNA invertase Pin-like site-specific DNA recombinase